MGASDPAVDPTNEQLAEELSTVDRLVAAAGQVFAERGYVAASIAEIARVAGFTPGAIYANFHSKAHLFATVVRGISTADDEHRRDIALASSDARSALLAWHTFDIERREQQRQTYLLNGEFFLVFGRGAPHMPEMYSERCRRTRVFLQTLIERHRLSSVIDVADLGVVVDALGDGLDVVSWYGWVPSDLYAHVLGVLLGLDRSEIPFPAPEQPDLPDRGRSEPTSPTDGQPGGRRRPQAKTLQRTIPALVDAAERLFLERGYAAVSVEEIAQAAGFSKTAVYANFGGKERLFLEVMVRGRHIASQRLAADCAGCSNVGDLLATLNRTDPATRRKCFEIFIQNTEFWLVAMRRPELADEVMNRFHQACSAVQETIEASCATDRLRPQLPPDRLAVAVVALDQGLDAYATFTPQLVSPTLLSRVTNALLHA